MSLQETVQPVTFTIVEKDNGKFLLTVECNGESFSHCVAKREYIPRSLKLMTEMAMDEFLGLEE